MTAIADIPASRRKAFAVLDEDGACRMVFVGADANQSHDKRLKVLVSLLGNLAANPDSFMNASANLGCIMGLCFGWSMALGNSIPFDKISEERDRQQQLFAAGKFRWNCASPGIDATRKLRVLTEEVGEVANAIDEIEAHGCSPDHLKTELIQVAAVACGWLESIL